MEQARPDRPDVFISYASPDVARADRLHDRLTSEGLAVWLDRKRLDPGCRWHAEIEAACEATRVMLPLITPRWATSEWTRYETYVHAAIIPVLAEGDPKETLPPPLRGLNGLLLDPLTADEAQWRALVAAIRRKLAEPVPERAPRLVDLPYQHNPFFTGRERDLERIHEALHTAPAAALTQGKVSALAAMGGIGKTTLANEYARRYWRLYPQILWNDARRGYQAELARQFDRLFPERAAAPLEPAEKARQALAELNGATSRLLVIDNAEDAESVRPWLPRAPTSGCRTLITSRFADWPQAEGIRAIQLYVLEPEPARAFLVHRAARPADGEELVACDALAKELGYLPLALEQAGAYIAATVPRVTFAGYLRLLRQATESLLAREARGSTAYPDPVVATWQTTMARLSPESRAVLRLCAWLADTPIPNAFVLEGIDDVLALAAGFGPLASRSASDAETELRLHEALTGLARYSMILDVTEESFRVHGLVQAVERLEAERAGHSSDGRDRALGCLAAVFPDAYDNPALWPRCRQLLPHQRALVDRLAPDQASTPLVGLLDRAGSFLRASGDAPSALPLYRRALEGSERVLGQDHPATLASVNNLAGCLQALGDARSALPLHQRDLEVSERVLGKDHPDTLVSVNNLAGCLRALGDASSALPLHRRALEVRERVLGQDHPATLVSVNNLAGCLESLGDASSALPLHRRALEVRERVLGQDHPNTLTSVNNLAGCLETLGDASSALPLYRRALEGSERVLGQDHPDTLLSVNNLAYCLHALGDASSALPLYRRALEVRERVLGQNHPDTLVSVNNLAGCLQALGDGSSALPLFRRALEVRERVLGQDHPDTLLSVNNLAGCLETLGDASSALPFYRHAFEGLERAFGEKHPQTMMARENLDRCHAPLQQAKRPSWWQGVSARLRGALGRGGQ